MPEQLWIVRVNGHTDADPASMRSEAERQMDMGNIQFPPNMSDEDREVFEKAMESGDAEIRGFMAVAPPPSEYDSDYLSPEIVRYHDGLKQKCGIMYTQVYEVYKDCLGGIPSECGFGQGSWSIGAVIKTNQIVSLNVVLVDKFHKALKSNLLTIYTYPVFEQEVDPDVY